ncbi:MAG: hypothetical protein H0W09_02735 [Solirubrobacterales bacterium]|nr:hypothetical protein [Solirubrobacterales bacterium]
MSIAGSVFLVAVGAILRYAINVDTSAIDLETIGLILMIAGIVGLALSFAYQAYASRSRRPAAPDPYERGYDDRVEEERPVRRPRR